MNRSETCNLKRPWPDSKFHGANMGPPWVPLAPDGPHVGPMDLAISAVMDDGRAVLWTSSALPAIDHDDVIKWKHFLRLCPFVWGIHRSPLNSPHKGQCPGALVFSLICSWNHEVGDLGHHRTHYDVTVMGYWKLCNYGCIISALATLSSRFLHLADGISFESFN